MLERASTVRTPRVLLNEYQPKSARGCPPSGIHAALVTALGSAKFSAARNHEAAVPGFRSCQPTARIF